MFESKDTSNCFFSTSSCFPLFSYMTHVVLLERYYCQRISELHRQKSIIYLTFNSELVEEIIIIPYHHKLSFLRYVFIVINCITVNREIQESQ